MSDVLKGRPKGPNLTSEGQNVVFKARRFPVDEYDLVDHTGMSQGHANNILQSKYFRSNLTQWRTYRQQSSC